MIVMIEVGNMKDLVPAIQFIGELVRVTTTIERSIPVEYEFDTDEVGGLPDEPQSASLVLLGVVLDSDELYLTLGIISEEGMPIPKVAIKHEDVKMIEYFDPEEDEALELISQAGNSSIQ